MDPLIQLQQDMTDALNGDPFFATISVASFRKLVILAEIERQIPHLTLKGGKMGCGVIVNMPAIFGDAPDISTPQTEVVCTFDVVENPEMNFFGSNGSQMACETVARNIRAVIQPLAIYGMGVFTTNNLEPVIAPLADIDSVYPGCAGYRVSLRLKFSEPFLPKVQLPTIAWAGDTFTLTAVTGGSTIYYTTDGTFPGPGNHGTKQDGTAGTAIQGTTAAVASGTVIRFAAYAANSTGSDVGQSIAP